MNQWNYSNNKLLREAYVIHATDLIEAKVDYEMSQPGYVGPLTPEAYKSKCLFAFTASTYQSAKATDLISAQRRLENEFANLYANELRHWGINNRKLNKRTAFLQPLIIAFFDVEGSRTSQGGTTATMPHYHGAMLLHHDTVETFFQSMSRNEVDGSCKKLKPSRYFSSIHFQSMPLLSDQIAYINYSSKYYKTLFDQNSSYCPVSYYPQKSKYFPFYDQISSSHIRLN